MLTVKEASEKLRIRKQTLYTWIKDGKLDYVQMGNRKLIREDVLERFIEENTVHVVKDGKIKSVKPYRKTR